MYTCNNCGYKTQNPEGNYVPEGEMLKVISSNNEQFDTMEYLHSEHSWLSCPKCGSDDLDDDMRALDEEE